MKRFRILTGLLLCLPVCSLAQGGPDDAEFDLSVGGVAEMTADGGFELGDVDFAGNPAHDILGWWPEDLILAPIPGYSPQLGWTLALGGGYFLGEQVEGGAPPSLLSGFGFIADNGSIAYGAGGKFNLAEDRVRLLAGAAYMDIRYRFYGIGSGGNEGGLSLDVLQEAPMYFGSASYRVWRRLFAGLGFLGGNVKTRPRIMFDGPLPFFDPTLDLDIAAITVPIRWDSRDHEQFPRNGWYVNGRTMLFRESVGSDFDAETFELGVNRYLPVREEDVIALRAYVRSTSGDAPFFLLSTFGGSKDLRGYPAGRYRDRMMYAMQGEYRWHVGDRWILTGFAGFGEVANDFSDFGDNFLPATGIGMRFVLSQKHRISLSADLATGKEGTEFYFGVGEAF
ncbi:MAG: BamA/TamA family outer membrane protein [Gammaproteobacteria bacterium]